MGRNQKSQRAKNNARPSNSGRSAELLENSDINLLGFSSLKGGNVYLTQNGNIGNDYSIPQDFQVVMKKMTKKDPITKQKALQEFSHLCKTTDAEQITGVLQGWPRLYNSLAVDNDPRVREAVQSAHKTLVCNAKRNIAPYLKEFIGTWFVSSFDNSSAAASVAKSSFQEVFPPPKRTEVIIFCQKEILNYIARNLINETPESMSNKANSAEEVRYRYERIICTNLNGYALLVERLPDDQILKNKDDHMQKIISTPKFWKFSKHESRMIRAPWFSLLVVLMKRVLYLIENEDRLCCTIYNRIDDPDPMVITLVWEALNVCSSKIPNWWDYICSRGVSLSKLYKVLASGCNESAAATMPCILTFLTSIKLPESVVEVNFYSNIFTNLIAGLQIPKIQKNPSDYEAVTSCFFDCVYFVEEKSCQKDTVTHFVGDEYVLTLIEKSIYDPCLYGSSSTVFLHFSYLMRAWKKLSRTKTVFDEIYKQAWIRVHQLLNYSLHFEDNMGKDDFEKRLRAHQKFINLLKNPHDVRLKKQLKVKFVADVLEGMADNKNDENTDIDIRKELSVVVKEMLDLYYHLMDAVPGDYRYLLINQICNILNTCNDKSYFKHFIELTSLKPTAGENVTSKLIDGLMKQWLSDKRVSVDAVLNVIFHLLIYLKDDDQITVLTNISEAHMGNMLDLCLHLVDGQLQTSIRKWLNGSYFRNTLRSFAEDLTKIKPISQEKLKVLKISFKMSNDQSCYASPEAKMDVLTVIKNFLTSCSPTNNRERLTLEICDDDANSNDAIDTGGTTATGTDGGGGGGLVVSEADIGWIGEIMQEVYSDVNFTAKYYDTVIVIVLELFKFSCELVCEQVIRDGDEDERLKLNDWEDLHVRETSMYWYSISEYDKVWVRGMEALLKCIEEHSFRFETITFHVARFVTEFIGRPNLPITCVYHLIRRVRLYTDMISWKTYKNAGEVFGDIKREMAGVNAYRYITISGIDEYQNPNLNTYCSNCYMIMRGALEAFMERAIEYCQVNVEDNIATACTQAEYCKGYFVYKEHCLMNNDDVNSTTAVVSSDDDDSSSDVYVPRMVNGPRNNTADEYSDYDEVKLNVENCFADLNRLVNFSYYIACLLEMYSPCQLLDKPNVVTSNENCEALKQTEDGEIVKCRIGLDLVSPVATYEVYLIAVLRSVKQHFFQTRYYDVNLDKYIDAIQEYLKDLISKHEDRPILSIQIEILRTALGEGVLWARTLHIFESEILDKESVNKRYAEIMLWSAKQNRIDYLIHMMEVFVPLLEFDSDSYKPDGSIDQDKLTIVTHYLRAKRVDNFNEEQEHLIWYWLDALLIQRKQVEVTYHTNLLQCRLSDIVLATIICRFLSVIADGRATLITKRRIDFIIICLASWVHSIKKTCNDYSFECNTVYNMPISIFICSVCDLLISMTKVVASPTSESTPSSVDDTSSDNSQQNLPGVESSDKLYIDWNNLFAKESNAILVSVWKFLADSPNRDNVEPFLVLNSMSNAVMHVVKGLDFDGSWHYSCSTLVNHPNISVRLAAYVIFATLSQEFAEIDMEYVDNFQYRTSIENLPFPIYDTITEYLQEFRVGEVPPIKSGSNIYLHMHSYLLTWYMAINLCENANSALRYRYATWLKEKCFLEPLLNNLATLLPDKLLQTSMGDITTKKLKDMFAISPVFTEVNADLVCNRLMHMVFHLYCRVLWILPSFVRQWWKSMDAKNAARIDRITTKFISPVLISEEIKAVKTIPQNDEKFSVRGYPTTRQIISTYIIEQVSVEITLTLAPNHPLGITKVEGNEAVSIYKRFTNWVKQMNMFLSHQNGLIKDGLLSWKNNVDKAFEGIEECYICFSILHSSNYELPKKSCRTCHKKFHGMCLYRWLISSSKSTCPICRGVF